MEHRGIWRGVEITLNSPSHVGLGQTHTREGQTALLLRGSRDLGCVRFQQRWVFRVWSCVTWPLALLLCTWEDTGSDVCLQIGRMGFCILLRLTPSYYRLLGQYSFLLYHYQFIVHKTSDAELNTSALRTVYLCFKGRHYLQFQCRHTQQKDSSKMLDTIQCCDWEDRSSNCKFFPIRCYT